MKKEWMITMVAMIMLIGCGQKTEPTVQANITTEAVSSADMGTSASKEEDSEIAVPPEDYPSKNISWIVPADAGAPLDIPTRAVIDNLKIDTNIIVENIAGASNTIGTLEAINRPADGYTLFTGSSSALILQPLMVDLAYDPEDVRIISLLKPMATYAVVVGPDSQLDSAEDWEKLIKSGERFTFSVSNAGSASHLSIVDALKQLNVDTGVYVPYNGGSEVNAALLNNEIDFAVLDTPAELQKAAKGDEKVLLIMSDKPDPLAPDIPVIADYGVTGMSVYFSLQCIGIRADTPEDIVEYLKQQINEAISSEAYQNSLKESGVGAMEIVPENEIESSVQKAREVYKELLQELDMISK